MDGTLAAGWTDRLAGEFDSLGAILNASDERLTRVLSDNSAPADPRPIGQLRLLATALREAVLDMHDDRPVVDTLQRLHDYLHVFMAHRFTESLRVLHLNINNVLIRDEQMAEGSIDQAPIYAREVARRALELGSSAVILVHNHPSGDPTPSRQDLQITRTVESALKSLDVRVHDHFIVAAGGHVSLRQLGLM